MIYIRGSYIHAWSLTMSSLFIAGSSTTFSKKAPSFPKSNPYQALQKDGKVRSPAIVCFSCWIQWYEERAQNSHSHDGPLPRKYKTKGLIPVTSKWNSYYPEPQYASPFILISHSLYQILIILRSLKLRRKFEPKLINRTKKKSTSLRGNLNRCKELILFEALTAAVSVPI